MNSLFDTYPAAHGTAWEFFVPGRPKPKGSFRAFKSKHTGKMVMLNDQAGTKPWQQDMKWFAYQHIKAVIDGPVDIRLTFHLRKPKKSKYPYDVPVTTPDVDKLARTALDAFSGIIFHDDRQVTSLLIKKIYHENIGVHVEVRAI